MKQLDIATLKKLVENMPEDFKIEYLDNTGINHLISDSVELNISEKKLCFKSA